MRRSGALLVIVVLTVVLAACDWPTFGFNAAGTRFTPDTSISLSAVVSGSPNRAWTGVTSSTVVVASSPAVANGVVYVHTNEEKLDAFDAAGTTNCSGSPKTCAPFWTAAMGGTASISSPAVATGVVFVGSDDHKLYAFDAAGTTNCSGSPKTCAPLWTATTGGSVDSSPTVANGVVYVGSDDHKLYAFDAAGTTNCSGSPKTCAPLWTATAGDIIRATPAVANGVLYVGSEKLYAFDAAGTTNCSPTPKTCTPLWTGSTAGFVHGIGVAGSTVYVGSGNLDPSFGMLSAFTAAPSNCRIFTQPLECFPVWRAGLGSAPSSPAIANGVVYIGELGGPLFAFDAAGKTGCAPQGGIRVCAPLWLAQTGASDQGSSPAVADGVVYIGTGQGRIGGSVEAFDASGTTNCSGAPKICDPVWISDGDFVPILSSPAVANHYVYVGGSSLGPGIAAFHFG